MTVPKHFIVADHQVRCDVGSQSYPSACAGQMIMNALHDVPRPAAGVSVAQDSLGHDGVADSWLHRLRYLKQGMLRLAIVSKIESVCE